MLCITMKVEPKICKAVPMPILLRCKNYRGKVMEDGKKCHRIIFWLTRGSQVPVSFMNLLSPPSIVKQVCTRSKKQPRGLCDVGKNHGN